MKQEKGIAHMLVILAVLVAVGFVIYLAFQGDYVDNIKNPASQQGAQMVDSYEKCRQTEGSIFRSGYPNNTCITKEGSEYYQPVEIPKDWVTHVSEKYNYSFQYYPTEEPQLRGGRQTITDDLVEIFGPDSLTFRLAVIESSATSPLEWWKSQEKEVYTELPNNNFIAKETDSIDYWGEKAPKIIDKDVVRLELKSEFQEPFKTYRTYIVAHDNKLFLLHFDYGLAADQILSTLKFTD